MKLSKLLFLNLLGISLILGHGDTTRVLVNDRNITINTSADITIKRQALISYIWKSAGFPYNKLPSSVQLDAANPIHGLDNLERVDTLHITMDNGVAGLTHHFIPKIKCNRLVVLYQGHVCTIDDGTGSGNLDYGIQKTINALLSNGFSVLALYMPQMGPSGVCEKSHNHMFDHFAPNIVMKFFFEPVAASLNYLRINHPNYQDISMIGLSGGGWATTVYAAIDPEIKLSFSVAGTLPLYLRHAIYIGDQEQHLPSFYKIAGYPDLYILSAYGVERKHFQILNRHDDCCFGENQHDSTQAGMSFDDAIHDYEARVQASLHNLNSGFFRVYIDEVAPRHMISSNTLVNLILPALTDRAPPFAETKAHGKATISDK